MHLAIKRIDEIIRFFMERRVLCRVVLFASCNLLLPKFGLMMVEFIEDLRWLYLIHDDKRWSTDLSYRVADLYTKRRENFIRLASTESSDA